jgi:hypothetical protein
MRVLLLVASFSLMLTDGTASAQSPSVTSSSEAEAKTPNDKSKPGSAAPSDQQRIVNMHAQCLKDWDVGTHMTKQEWGRICRRVVDDRAKYLDKEGRPLPTR